VKGKLGEVTVVHSLGLLPPRRLVLSGWQKDEMDAETVRRTVGNAVKTLNQIGVRHAALVPPETNRLTLSDLALAIGGSDTARQLPIQQKNRRATRSHRWNGWN